MCFHSNQYPLSVKHSFISLYFNKAGYTTTSVSCDLAGAVMQKPLANAEKSIAGRTDGPTDGPTDRPTDGRTKPLIELRFRN